MMNLRRQKIEKEADIKSMADTQSSLDAIIPAPLSIIIPWVGPTLNSVYAGQHWRQRYSTKKVGALATFAAIVDKKSKLKPEIKANLPFNTPVCLEFTPIIATGRRYDATNYALTAKIIEDTLVKQGILRNDDYTHVFRVVLNAPVKVKKGANRMIVKIIPLLDHEPTTADEFNEAWLKGIGNE